MVGYMLKNTVAIIIFCIISMSIAYVLHKKIKSFLYASIAAGVLTSLIYQIIGIAVIGYLDPYFLIAFAIGSVFAFFIAILIGIPIACKRKTTRIETALGTDCAKKSK